MTHHYEWRTDGVLPTREDADEDGLVYVTIYGKTYKTHYSHVRGRLPWMPMLKPEPYDYLQQVEGELKTLFELIDQEQFGAAREAIAVLGSKIGNDNHELVRARTLIHFLEERISTYPEHVENKLEESMRRCTIKDDDFPEISVVTVREQDGGGYEFSCVSNGKRYAYHYRRLALNNSIEAFKDYVRMWENYHANGPRGGRDE